MKFDLIVIGAGASGLLAAKDMADAGHTVCVLEAAAIAGGRIATIQESGIEQPLETGAEFVHGKLPLTLQLLNKANIDYIPVEGKMVAVQKGKWLKQEAHDKHWDAFMQQLAKLKTDISIGHFLEQYFSGSRYASLRGSVQRFSEGFDLGDINYASAIAARQEWGHEEETQYRIPGGYMQLINYLLAACKKHNAAIHYNACVTKIEYNKETATVFTKDNRQFEAAAVLVTVSAGMLQSNSLEFKPALDNHYSTALRQLGFGTVIKILLQFKTAFWTKHEADIGFIISDEAIPTWWTQLPIENNLLTGWFGGPSAAARSGDTDEALLQTALVSLANIFHTSPGALRDEIVYHTINCWHNHPFVKGGYSYVTTESANAKKILSHPVEDIIFFAGEAFYRGESQGTVEAALQSGRMVAKLIRETNERLR